MGLLFRNRKLAVTTVRDELGMTDGNLASHLLKLEAAGYVKQGRVLVGLGFELQVKITEAGSVAFRGYLAGLRRYLEGLPEAETATLGEAPASDAAPSPRSSASARS